MQVRSKRKEDVVVKMKEEDMADVLTYIRGI